MVMLVNWFKVKAFRYEKEDTTQIQYKYKFQDKYKSMKTNLLKRRKTKPATKQYYDENDTFPPPFTKTEFQSLRKRKRSTNYVCAKKKLFLSYTTSGILVCQLLPVQETLFLNQLLMN
uniref:Uncharacterized protein n=1 Tax=Cacopsylla melanoneura TaxID=428564 RepID=A0A8D8WSS4_9HEMI